MLYIRAMKDIYDGDKTRFRTVEGDSKHFLVEIGRHQDCAEPFSICLGDG